MELRNQKIIQAIIQKAERICPESLALIGIYGSFLTGDVHRKSDLDLMVLINDERGYQLASTFIQDDQQIGHDIYCTTWDMLERDAEFTHPHISKLMDSKIVYCADEKYLIQLEKLRQRIVGADTRKAAEKALREAEHCYTLAMLTHDLSKTRVLAGSVIQYALDAVALLNKQYFRLGTKRVFDEIDTMEHKPEHLRLLVDAIISSRSAADMKSALSRFIQAAEVLFELPIPYPEILPGTYEEMFSNWRNKMYLAAETGDRYLAFNSMCALDSMLRDLGFSYDVLGRFDPDDLEESARGFDAIIEDYRENYDKTGLRVQRYPDVNKFIEDYLKIETAQ